MAGPPVSFFLSTQMPTDAFFSSGEITRRRLESPLLPAFDCGREAQNQFLSDWAWHDQNELVSATHLYFVRGMLGAYATISLSALTLGSREKPRAIRHKSIGAVKVLQLGVDRRFQGRRLGTVIIADMIALARVVSRRMGCRYLVLDAQPEVVGWYEARGFRINKAEQKQRMDAAVIANRPLDEIAVSMRFDLLDYSRY
jgi:GNAT superfamily N-acetyltransferase